MVGSETLRGREYLSVSVESKGLDQASLLEAFSQQRPESDCAIDEAWDLRSDTPSPVPQVPGYPGRSSPWMYP